MASVSSKLHFTVAFVSLFEMQVLLGSHGCVSYTVTKIPLLYSIIKIPGERKLGRTLGERRSKIL